MNGHKRIHCISDGGSIPPGLTEAAIRDVLWDVTSSTPTQCCVPHGDIDALVLEGPVTLRMYEEYLAQQDATVPILIISDYPPVQGVRTVHVVPHRDATEATLYHLISAGVRHSSKSRGVHEARDKAWSILDSIDTQVWSFDLESRTYLNMNDARRRFLGTRARDMQMGDALSDTDASSCMSTYNLAIQTGHPVEKKQWMANAAGELRLLHIRKFPIMGHNGVASFIVCTATDVTAQEQTKKELMESRERYRSLVEHIPVAIWEEDYSTVKGFLDNLIEREGVTDIETYLEAHPETVRDLVKMVRITSINAAGQEMYGATSLDQCISSISSIFSESSYQMFSRTLCAMVAGIPQISGDDVNFTIDGRRMDLYATWTAVHGHEKTYDQVIVSALDITSRKGLERQLKRQKEELSAFAHTLAHDMRGPLTSILTHAELAKESLPGDDLDVIITRARELGVLVNTTLDSALEGIGNHRGRCDDVKSVIADIALDVVPHSILSLTVTLFLHTHSHH